MESLTNVEARQDKHLDIDAAIENINGVLSRVEQMIRRVADVPSSDEVGTNERASQSLSLESVLSNGANRIDEKCKQLYSALDQLEEMLF